MTDAFPGPWKLRSGVDICFIQIAGGCSSFALNLWTGQTDSKIHKM